MPLLRQRQERFRKEEKLFDPDGKLIRLRAEQVPSHPDGIAQVQQMKEFESLFSENIFLYIDLDALPGPLQVRESGFAHKPQGNDPPGDAYSLTVRLQLRTKGVSESFHQCGRRIRPAKFAGIRFMPQRLNLLEFLQALFKLVARLKLQWKILSDSNAGEYSGPRLL
jgi:hypothetical protein